jgi:hypothetical protein
MGGMGGSWSVEGTRLGRRRGLGTRRRRHGFVELTLMFFSSVLVPFVKGDSYPEICAQRTDEGDGFPLCERYFFGRYEGDGLLWRRGRGASGRAGLPEGPWWVVSFVLLLATYPFGMQAVKQESFIHSFIPNLIYTWWLHHKQQEGLHHESNSLWIFSGKMSCN